ncbi:hypothetical protein IAU59_000478 [Kwoniella sp. CBS 9459]
MSGIGLGLGLGLSSVDLESATLATIIAEPSIKPGPTAHPAYVVSLQARSHRGPRSLGVGKRFVSSPSPTLLPTIYDKTPSNPLSIPSNAPLPFNSPQMELDLVHINPTQHLRAMKKRSLASRNFGLGSSDPLDHSSTSSSTMDISSAGTVAAASASSPTIGSSPTLGYSSPVMSSPVPHEHHIDMVGPSIALSVVLGLIVLGVAGWAGFAYRRRTRQAAIEGYGTRTAERDSDEKSFTSEMFAASNVVEKGLKPRARDPSNEDLRSSFISYKRPPASATGHGAHASGERRVSFVDTPHDEPEYGRYHAHDQAYYEDMRSRRQSMVVFPRVMTASIMGDGRDEEEYAQYEEGEEYEFPTPSPRSSIAPTLERIDEESSSIPTSGSEDTIDQLDTTAPPALNDTPTEEMDLADAGRYTPTPDARPASVASSVSSANTSDYTTASARSSISSLSALSILSSSFPPTPRDPGTPPTTYTPQSPAQVHGHENEHESHGIYDSPTPTSKFQARRKRAQSQGVMEVKHDLLRTAVGRTMSLQPSKEVANALRKMTAGAEVDALPALPQSAGEQDRGRAEDAEGEINAIEEMRVAAMVAQRLDAEAAAQDIADSQAITQGGNSPAHEVNVTVPRSTSFPAKLLSRRKSQHHPASPTRALVDDHHRNTAEVPTTRRSEIITNGYLKRALRAFRGEGEDGQAAVPALPSNIPMPNSSSSSSTRRSHEDTKMTTCAREEEMESIRHLAERQAQLERYLALIQAQSQSSTPAQQAPRIAATAQTRSSTSANGEFDNKANLDEEEDEGEESDMDLDDSYIPSHNEDAGDEVLEQDSVWDADEYGADMEMEGEGGMAAFDEYYLHFEGDEGDNQAWDNGAYSGHSYVHDQGCHIDQSRAQDREGGRGVPHIRVTSH